MTKDELERKVSDLERRVKELETQPKEISFYCCSPVFANLPALDLRRFPYVVTSDPVYRPDTTGTITWSGGYS
jgi:hypothetical protein